MRFAVRYVAAGAAAVSEETLDAVSEAELRAHCAAQGRTVLSVRAAVDARKARSPRFDAAWWCRELRTLLRSGMTVVEAVETLAANRHDALRDRVHAGLLKSLREGQALSRAMRSAGVFPAVLVAGVTASERTSTLADALDDYLRYDEMIEGLRRQAVSAAIYPAVVVGLGLLITLFLLVFVMPRFSRIYVDAHADLSAVTQAVLLLSRALQQHLPLVLAALAGVCIAGAWAVRRGALARGFARMVEAVEPLRRQWQHYRLAKLYQSLALMCRGGYTLDEALEVGQGLDLGARVEAAIGVARGAIARGKSASAAFAVAGLTETVTERLLAVGERTGAFDAVLQTVSERHAQTFATFVERATRIVEPILLLGVALVVGGVVVMMYMPVFDMAGSIGGGK